MSEQLEQAPDSGNQGQPAETTKQNPVFTPQEPAKAEQKAEPERDFEAEIKALRAEAAKYRVERNEAQSRIKELEPAAQKLTELEEAQKSEEQKLREKLERLEAEKQAAEQAAELARRESSFARLAAKAGVDPEIAALLDISKFNLSDEAAALETLSKLKPIAKSIGGPSNPAQNGASNKQTDDELRYMMFGGGRSQANNIFKGS